MYLVPKNVGGRFEFFEGFGFKELTYCLIAGAISIGFSLFLGIFIHSIFRFLPVPILIYVTYMLVRVDPRLGKSLLDNMITINSFHGKPKRYDFIYGEGRKDSV